MKSAFAETLGHLRRERKLSQRRAAADLGISQALLSHYENDTREPKLEFVVKVCNYYEVSADYLLGRTDEFFAQTLPVPHSCDGAPRLVSTACAVFRELDERSDKELYSTAVDYLVIPIETVAIVLNNPGAQYDPTRDAKLKMAEAALLTSARKTVARG